MEEVLYHALVTLGRRHWVVQIQATHPTSRVYLCPQCGRLWGAVMMGKRRYTAHEYVLCSMFCDPFRAYLYIPGSLLDTFDPAGYDTGLLEALPTELLKREFELHLSAYEVIQCPLPQTSLSYHSPSLQV